jgi:F-type H+-transporting ATPase subunit delta
MPNPRLAARYAKSLLDLAIEQGQLETVYKDMLFMQHLCNISKELVNLLRSPIIKADKKDKILQAVGGGKLSSITAGFIRLLMAKGREPVLPEIITAFISQYKAHKGIQIVKLTTAVPASEELKEAILQKVRKERNMQHVELETEVRNDLIGGFILQIGDELMDGSVTYELNNVRKQFQNNDFVYKLR